LEREADFIIEERGEFGDGSEEYIVQINENTDELIEEIRDELQDISDENPELDNIGMVSRENSIYAETTSGYGFCDTLEGKNMVTGVYVVARTKYQNILGPRKKPKKINEEKHNNLESRKDVVAFCVRRAMFLIDSGEFKIRNGKDTMEEYKQAESIRLLPHERRRPGWAIRPKQGKTYGTMFIKEYKADIEAYFSEGEKDSTKKSSPDIMIERLKEKYAGRYSLPGYNEVRQLISKIIKKRKEDEKKRKAAEKRRQKKEKEKEKDEHADILVGVKRSGSSTTEDMSRNKRRKRVVISDAYIDTLKGLLVEDRRMKPAVALRIFKEKYIDDNGKYPGDFPDDQRIKSKFSNIKNSFKIT